MRLGGQAAPWILALVILISDRLSKWWIVEVYDLPSRYSVEVLPFFNLTMVWNQGVSFGLLSGAGLNRWILFSAVMVVVFVLIVWMIRAQGLLLKLALGALIGGAVGNAIDRLIYDGKVADFFDFHAWGWHFWVFNVADSAISIGVVLLLIDAVFGSGKQEGQPASR